MKQSITESYFVDQIVGDDYNSMSYDGAKALFEYFEQLEEDLGEEIDFAPIAICCDFTQYESLDELNEVYGKDFKDLEEVGDYTQVIEVTALDTKTMEYVDGGFIVQDS